MDLLPYKAERASSILHLKKKKDWQFDQPQITSDYTEAESGLNHVLLDFHSI